MSKIFQTKLLITYFSLAKNKPLMWSCEKLTHNLVLNFCAGFRMNTVILWHLFMKQEQVSENYYTLPSLEVCLGRAPTKAEAFKRSFHFSFNEVSDRKDVRCFLPQMHTNAGIRATHFGQFIQDRLSPSYVYRFLQPARQISGRQYLHRVR